MTNADNIALTGRGVVVLTFSTKDEEAKKVRIYKELFIQRAVANGLTLQAFHQYTGAATLAAATAKGQVMAYLQNTAGNTDKITALVNWLFEQGYLTDKDIMDMFGGTVAQKAVESENFALYKQPKKPWLATAGDFAGHEVSVRVDGAPNNNGFLVTLTVDGKPWTYPDAMTIEEAADCVRWLQERHGLPWEAVSIPVADLIKQADKSITCRRVLKQAHEDGIQLEMIESK
jgi:hypothetical protein